MRGTEIVSLLGGLALFLYGMQMMSNGLETSVGNQMKQILEKLTSNRFKAVLVGAAITAVIQSSSATTVMVVGFVNSGLMTLGQAVWIIMGANIGTTITGQLIALDIGMIAPLIAFAGVAVYTFSKKEKICHISSIFAGLGILFIGMEMMSSAMEPLQESPAFIHAITKFNNPLIGIIVGALFTAVIQSSSAAVGILQALAGTGTIPISYGVFILFGTNIGTCVTAVLASVGTKTNARRATLLHLLFNCIGTILFTGICLLTPFLSWITAITPGNPVAQIANTHTAFNVVTTLVLLPFGGLMVKFVTCVLKENQSEEEETKRLQYLLPFENKLLVGNTSMQISQLEKEVIRMLQMVKENVLDAFDMLLERKQEGYEKILWREDYIDYLNSEISKHLIHFTSAELSEVDSGRMKGYYLVTSNLERIGDHATNVAEYAKLLQEKKLELSSSSLEEVKNMKRLCSNLLTELEHHDGESPRELLKIVAQKEQEIDDLNRQYLNLQIQRMQDGACSPQTGLVYTELLTDFERIGDHALNIAELYQEIGL